MYLNKEGFYLKIKYPDWRITLDVFKYALKAIFSGSNLLKNNIRCI